MITTEQAYIKFLLKVNENFDTSKIAVDKGRFVELFNESQNKLIEFILDKKNEDDIRYIQKILVPEYKVSSSQTSKYYQLFELPKDYFDFASVYGKASTEDCTNKQISLYEAKSDNINEILSDEFNKPSFLAREAPFYLSSDNVKVYRDDFTYQSVHLTYYRYPTQVKLLDERDPESGFHPNYNPEFDAKFTDRVISIASGEFELNSESQKFQMDKQRSIQKI